MICLPTQPSYLFVGRVSETSPAVNLFPRGQLNITARQRAHIVMHRAGGIDDMHG